MAKLVTDFIDEKQLTSNEIQLIEEEINKNSLRYEYLNEIENKSIILFALPFKSYEPSNLVVHALLAITF